MYATSKLIIPPKPARNSPFIPKLRIKLRPTLGRVRPLHSLHSDTSHRTTQLDYAKDASITDSAGSFSPILYMNGETHVCESAGGPDSSDHRESLNETASSHGKRNTGKRKRASIVLENIGLDSPESILTKINLKAIINRETFYALPVETQRMLADLLPMYDGQKQAWTTYSSEPEDVKCASSECSSETQPESDSVWLHPSALSNEFFGKALQDYAARQAQGDFAQRVRNRAGLRASAGCRSRYSATDLSEDKTDEVVKAPSHNGDTSRLNRVRRATPRSKQINQSSGSLVNQPNGHIRRVRKMFSSVSTVTGVGTLTCIKTKPCPAGTKLVRRNRNLLRASSARCMNQFVPSSTESSISTVPVSITSPLEPAGAVFSVSSEHHYLRDSDHDDTAVVSHITSSGNSSMKNPENAVGFESGVENSQSASVLSSPSPQSQKSTEPVSSPRQTKQPHSISQSLVPMESMSGEGKYSSPACSPRSSRGSRSQISHLESPLPPPMPPPRQTKTLAAMREKIRAKRMMKEAERQVPGQSYYGLPGSMTPHPASGACGYFHQPTGYPPSGGFGTSPSSEFTKRSSSALSSPRSLNATPPLSCDKQSSTVQSSLNLSSLLHSTPETGFNKRIIDSPSSPCSLPNTELLSPSLNNPIPNKDFLAHLGPNDGLNFTTECDIKSYPSSPYSTSSPGLPVGTLLTGPAYSPQSLKLLPTQLELRQEQSISAPPTPLASQVGQNLFNRFNNTSSHTFYTSVLEPSSTHLSRHASLMAVSLPSSLPNVTSKSTLILGTSPGSSSGSHPTNITYSLPSPKAKPTPVFAPSGAHLGSNSTLNSPQDVIQSQPRASCSYPPLPACTQLPSTMPTPTSSQCTSLLTSVTSVSEVASLNSNAGIVQSCGASSAVSQLLAGASSRSSTTTRAFFVDGNNLSQALELLQNLNPKAVITQQQFLLIPNANKSQIYLYPAPSTTTTTSGNTIPANLLGLSSSKSQSTATASMTTVTKVSSSEEKHHVDSRQIVTPENTAAPVLTNYPTTRAVQIVSNIGSTANGSTPFAVNMNPPMSSVSPHITAPNNVSRTLVCSKAAAIPQLICSPNLVPLKPQLKQPASVFDVNHDLPCMNPRSISPKFTIPAAATKIPPASVGVVPTTQSQITISLVQSNSVLNTETPLLLLPDTSRPTPTIIHQNAVSADVIHATLTPDQTYLSNLNHAMKHSLSTTFVASPHLTVINSCAPSIPCSQQITTVCEVPLTPVAQHTNSHVFATGQPTLMQASPIGCYSNQPRMTNYIPGATTVVSHGCSTFMFPHNATLQTVQPKNSSHLAVSRDNINPTFIGPPM
ncbi:hypothetical protein PHET_08281 [Paragonimus heterotremus]|uniref:ASX DEUBAD domain-containing protein n=1 Tax=Paragonimus heterotremus TaxID=100268 RepID=A0A8J4TDV2_9TREM|nr:hypothetical protein PHET_08281 [Paragonimus heterotremus]